MPSWVLGQATIRISNTSRIAGVLRYQNLPPTFFAQSGEIIVGRIDGANGLDLGRGFLSFNLNAIDTSMLRLMYRASLIVDCAAASSNVEQLVRVGISYNITSISPNDLSGAFINLIIDQNNNNLIATATVSRNTNAVRTDFDKKVVSDFREANRALPLLLQH